MDKLKNLAFIVVIGVLMIHKVNHQLIICLYSMILVNRSQVIFIKVIIRQYLPMGKQAQANHIQYKDINKKEYYSYVYKIYSNEKRNKMMQMGYQHK